MLLTLKHQPIDFAHRSLFTSLHQLHPLPFLRLIKRTTKQFRHSYRMVSLESSYPETGIVTSQSQDSEHSHEAKGYTCTYLEDRDTEGNLIALVRPLDRELIQARAEQESLAQAKLKAKAEMEAKKLEQEKAATEKAKISPEVMFRTEEFKEWDDMGVPTIDAKGDEMWKCRRKKLVKQWEKQRKLYDEWKATQE